MSMLWASKAWLRWSSRFEKNTAMANGCLPWTKLIIVETFWYVLDMIHSQRKSFRDISEHNSKLEWAACWLFPPKCWIPSTSLTHLHHDSSRYNATNSRKNSPFSCRQKITTCVPHHHSVPPLFRTLVWRWAYNIVDKMPKCQSDCFACTESGRRIVMRPGSFW